MTTSIQMCGQYCILAPVSQPVITPKEVMCSFCVGNTHDYRDCPTMHQYIREQADALAQRRMGEYQQPQEWGGL